MNKVTALAISFALPLILAVSLPQEAKAARQVACVTKAGLVVVKRKCNSKAGESLLNLASLIAQAKGATGEKGEKGDPGANGVDGATGPQGEPGPLVQTLPSGETLRGRFRVGSTSPNQAHSVISFPIPLASTPTLNWIVEPQPPTQNCPGNWENPEAAPGHFCLYTANSLSNNWGVINFGTAISRFGFPLEVSGFGGSFYMGGTWAVTAP